jgi:hypothetical protein
MLNSIFNANAYRDGNTLIGKIEQIDLPNIKFKTEDIAALGLFSSIEIPTGLEKMEAKIKWNAIYDTDWKAASPVSKSTIVVKANMTKHGADGRTQQVQVTATVRGIYKELPSGNLKSNSKFDGAEHLMTVNYYKLEVAGAKIYEVDIFNNILFVGSEDILESFRSNQ